MIGYKKLYKEVITRLIDGANNTAKLTKTHCVAVLTLGFACKTATGSKLGELQQDLKGEIGKEVSEKPFWTSLAETSSSKRPQGRGHRPRGRRRWQGNHPRWRQC